jgi:tRNA dimethylallyltransferase
MGVRSRQALIIAGPTCSGKSVLALALARRLGGTVINADAMQVYRELRILTARPTPADEAAVPHALYGIRPVARAGDVAWWRTAALAALEDAPGMPILCGGTGLYFRSLVHGLADIPPPDQAARADARALLQSIGAPALHARLRQVDPQTAGSLQPADSQRVARAWEVFCSTGRGLAEWQSQPHAPLAGWRFTAIRLDPPRETLRAAITSRFAAMLQAGALAEVAALLDQRLDPALPGMRAHGVPELSAHLRGETSLDEAAARAIAATGRYTKRQRTWLRHHALADPSRTHIIHARIADMQQLSESYLDNLITFIINDDPEADRKTVDYEY